MGNGFCDVCADGCGGAMCACFCNPCYWAKTRNMFDESNWFFNCCCLGGVATQNIIREAYDIEGNCCWDILGVSCFGCCAAINESRGRRTRTHQKIKRINRNTTTKKKKKKKKNNQEKKKKKKKKKS